MMWNSLVKLIVGVWLILSGFLTTLQSPVNLVIVGALLAVCCFLSHKTWQIVVTGILGLWLFLSGMINLLGSAGVSLVTGANFLIVGILVVILGVWSYMKESRLQETES